MKNQEPKQTIRLNRYIAQAGVCSRRKADELISQGKVKVNGKMIQEMGFQVARQDDVRVHGRKIHRQKKTYILMNKSSGILSTTDDPFERKTVVDLLKSLPVSGLFPIGRLDKETTGLLLITNDGDFAQQLAHPSYEIKKVYQITLDKALLEKDLNKIRKGVYLEDGKVTVDKISLLTPKKGPQKIFITLHSGKNRVLRRLFKALHYRVRDLERIEYGNLKKKGLKRGAWRFLEDHEIRNL